MPVGQNMQELVRGILGSHQDRTADIARIQDEVRALHQDVSTMLNGYGEKLADASSGRAAASQELRKALTRDRVHLRQRTVASLKESVGQMKRSHDSRIAAASELRAGLTNSTAGLKQDVEAMLEGFGRELRVVGTTRIAEGKKLRDGLARSGADLRQDVGAVLDGFDAVLAEVRDALAEGRNEWQKMAATMKGKRTAVATAAIPPEPAPPAAEDAAAMVQPFSARPDSASIGARTFEYLANHPDGTRLVELEQEMGLARIQMATAIRGLIEQNKVEKRGPLYFAI